ncbi:hypothetical protein PRZ48_009945 [Zasmidium cellare]|uniref:IQ calmodulin-binding motif protein n=1 Tax=Zasmidium cellare TaxID=395010 RepID=A0ABR0EDV0_ZASCE|nr:hypothetical protein PRZ48_009945 [Zasmidium cellare]
MSQAEEEGQKPHLPHPSLDLPSKEALREIARKQEERAKVIRERRQREGKDVGEGQDEESSNAAKLIQRNYRGHRERRALEGYGLSPGTRWLEALKDAEYTNFTKPQSRADRFSPLSTTTQRVKDRWAHAGAIAKRVGSDDTSDSEGDDNISRASERARRKQQKSEREKYAKTMGLEYFLELVDQKHRYGSNLRRYHQEWKKSDTQENFFYWLDFGEGREIDLEDRPRERLDREQVRYLSREERKNYLVRIDGQGRFVWDKDGEPITTSPDFKDSIDGIVHASDDTPTWREVTTGEKPQPKRDEDTSDSSSTNTSISTGSQEDGSKYVNEEFHNAKGVSKLNHVSVDALMNHLLRKTTKKNTWIFVADTSFRLYVGIKQSGAFQHSSFLKGARVSAAGLIKIKRGQIRKLSPLSGHYAPPVRNFREFLKSLKAAGADLSRLNVSRSYAVILGLEGYVKVKKRGKQAKRGVWEALHPDEKRKREEAEKDKSQSAEKERQVLAAEERVRRRESKSWRLMKRVGLKDEEDDGGGGSPEGTKSPASGVKSPVSALRRPTSSGQDKPK